MSKFQIEVLGDLLIVTAPIAEFFERARAALRPLAVVRLERARKKNRHLHERKE